MAIPATRPITPPACDLVPFDEGLLQRRHSELLTSKAQEAYQNALKGPTQLSFHYAAGLCETLRANDLAIKCYSSAINAFYRDPARDCRILVYDSYNLGHLYRQSQQWKEALGVYSNVLRAEYLPFLKPEDKQIFMSMKQDYNKTFFNLVSTQRPDLLVGKDGTRCQKIEVDFFSPLACSLKVISQQRFESRKN